MKLLFCTLLTTVCIFVAPAAVRAEPIEEPITEPVFDTEALTSTEAAEASVPVIMYHLVTEKRKYIGKYGITPADFEADLVYLRDQGYTTVVMADLIDFVTAGTSLPDKPILLTFDDGNSADLLLVLPLLEKYDARAVFSIIGEAADRFTQQKTDNPKAKFPNLTWCEIKTLHESGRAEIQSHGYDVHGKYGAGIRRGEGADAYHARLAADLKKLQALCQEHIGFELTTFTYPLGIFSPGTQAVLEEVGFVASLSCQEGRNVLTVGKPQDLFRLNRSNRPANRPIGTLLESIK
ncbi:MAG: polysaccharide deacetylase family protein [Defluviitaleaceae bacterium]|nr:polysaccharide deacetylase family protein [Defluviitaleaceae bacterium]